MRSEDLEGRNHQKGRGGIPGLSERGAAKEINWVLKKSALARAQAFTDERLRKGGRIRVRGTSINSQSSRKRGKRIRTKERGRKSWLASVQAGGSAKQAEVVSYRSEERGGLERALNLEPWPGDNGERRGRGRIQKDTKRNATSGVLNQKANAQT